MFKFLSFIACALATVMFSVTAFADEVVEAVAGPDTATVDLINLLMSIPVIGPYVPWILAIVTAASSAAAIVPTPKPGTIWAVIYKFLIDWPALNIGKAKDKGATK